MCPRAACNVSSSYMMRHVRLLCCVKKMNDGYDVSSVSLLFCLLLLKFIMWVLVSAWSETDTRIWLLLTSLPQVESC